MATTLPGLNRILDTVELDGHQWRACLVAVLGYLVVAELGKLILRRFTREPAATSGVHAGEPPPRGGSRRRPSQMDRPANGHRDVGTTLEV